MFTMRLSWSASGLLVVALSLGCEALVQFKKVPDGAGGMAASGGSGGSAGGTGSATGAAGGTSSSTTMPSMCTGQSDCPSPGPCVEAACKSGMCEHTNLPAGTPVSNDDAKDCLKQVCDDKGAVTSAFDDSESPAAPGGDCFVWACKDGAPVKTPINGGGLCGSQPANPCQMAACNGVDCTVQPANDGKVVDSKVSGSCNDSVCINGGTDLKANDKNCPSPGGNGCVVAVCNSDGACGTKYVTVATFCIKSNTGNAGTCDGNGHCCNLGGCD